MINQIQELNLKLIELSSFNNLDGSAVAEDLKNNPSLWDGVILDRGSYGTKEIDLIKLRDIKEGYWNVDTLYILCPIGKENDLINLAKTWGADEVDFFDIDQSQNMLGSSGDNRKVLRVWFD